MIAGFARPLEDSVDRVTLIENIVNACRVNNMQLPNDAFVHLALSSDAELKAICQQLIKQSGGMTR
jgi:hypothetical protein